MTVLPELERALVRAAEIGVLEEFGRDPETGVRQVPARPRRGRRILVASALGIVIAVPAIAATGGFDFGGDIPRAGEPGGPPRTVTATKDTRTIAVLETVLGPDGVQALRDAVEPYGLRVKVNERPVADAAVGIVFGVQFPRQARFDQRQRLVLEKGMRGTILLTIGRAARAGERPGTAGLSLYQVLPQVERAVKRADPAGTGRRLEALGFSITWRLVIDNPDRGAPARTGVKTVSEPPAGTVILSVLNRDGSNSATKDTRALLVEIAPKDSDVARSHP